MSSIFLDFDGLAALWQSLGYRVAVEEDTPGSGPARVVLSRPDVACADGARGEGATRAAAMMAATRCELQRMPKETAAAWWAAARQRGGLLLMPEIREEFGAFVREALRRASMSHRDVVKAANGEVSHSTLGEMKAGIVPTAEKVLAAALAVGDDPDTWLAKAGKPFSYRPR